MTTPTTLLQDPCCDRKIERGVMVMKDGKAWGIVYEDGHSTAYGWMPPAGAPIHDPEYYKQPTDVTYPGSYLIPQLLTGKLVAVERVTEVFLVDSSEVK